MVPNKILGVVETHGDLVRRMSNDTLARFVYRISSSPASPSFEYWLQFLNSPIKRKGIQCSLADIYRIQFNAWIVDHLSKFYPVCTSNQCYGTIDKNYIYVINRYFYLFCNQHGYDSTDVLKKMWDAGYIKTRQGQFKGGYLKSVRIGGKPESCVWLVRDNIFNDLKGLIYENT